MIYLRNCLCLLRIFSGLKLYFFTFSSINYTLYSFMNILSNSFRKQFNCYCWYLSMDFLMLILCEFSPKRRRKIIGDFYRNFSRISACNYPRLPTGITPYMPQGNHLEFTRENLQRIHCELTSEIILRVFYLLIF